MPVPLIVPEVWDLQGLIREVARLKAQQHVLTQYTQTVADKHNTFVENTAVALAVRKEKIERAKPQRAG